MNAQASAFGRLLRGRRRASGLTLEELAASAGVGVRTVSDLERGRTASPYRQTVASLARALGLEGAELEEFVALSRPAVLPACGRQDQAAAPGWAAAALGGSEPLLAIRQLPPPVPHFVGRADELKELDEMRDAAQRLAAVTVINGPAGTGKTSLAVHWAHLASESFPDGQLYLNLNGFSPAATPLTPAQALALALQALQVPAGQIPVGTAGRASLWRSLMNTRQMLIILDNAWNEEQVRPLLPGGPGCAAVVTSRSRLTGLIALEAARSIPLGVLPQTEAREMVARRLGRDVVAAQPAAVDRLIRACARLPLAIAIAVALVATRPGSSLEDVAHQLTDNTDIVEVLDAGEASASLSSVFAWSYRTLTPPSARLFCLLAEHPGPDVSKAAAASLAGIGSREVGAALAELASANLITEQGSQRFGLHDLLRQYAGGQLRTLYSPAERQAAGRRMLDHYARTATAAAIAISPRRNLPAAGPPVRGSRPEPIGNSEDAFAWFQSEHQILLRVTAYAADTGADDYAWRVPFAITDFQDRAGYWNDWLACQQVALAAAERIDDIAIQSSAHRYLGRASFMIQRHDDAIMHLTRSVGLRQQVGPPEAEAGIHLDLCRVHENLGDPGRALQAAKRALAMYQAAQHSGGQAYALSSIGLNNAYLRRYPAALRYCEQALSIASEIGDKRAQAHAWENIGYISQHTSQIDKAITCYQQALALQRELADRYFTARMLTLLGGLASCL